SEIESSSDSDSDGGDLVTLPSVPKVNLNTASAGALQRLPGIGVKTAKRIITRRSNTAFTDPEELVTLGIMQKGRFNGVKDALHV
ncbi:MAG TPA: helix-hairpin-helix domain-containing protein, partial [Longimicrobium sp.]|nr:helix-hairpin-helix domain-containing protein [Longimicrobium sp.]